MGSGMPRARLSGQFRLRHPRNSGLRYALSRGGPASFARGILATLGSEMPRESWSGQFRLRHPRNTARWPRSSLGAVLSPQRRPHPSLGMVLSLSASHVHEFRPSSGYIPVWDSCCCLRAGRVSRWELYSRLSTGHIATWCCHSSASHIHDWERCSCPSVGHSFMLGRS